MTEATRGPRFAFLRRRVFRAAAFAIVSVVILAGVFLRHYWDSLTGEAQARGAQISYLLAEQTARTFQAVDLTLRGLEPLLVRESVPDHTPDFETLLRRRVAELDFIRLIIVTDAAGTEIETSEPGPPRIMLHADRPSFKALAGDPTLSVVIGQADTGRDRQNRGISVARRLTAPDGRFNGMLLAEIEPRYFAKFFDGLDLGRHATINLYQDNGRTLLASTESSPVPFDGLRLPRVSPGGEIDRVTPSQPTGSFVARKLVAYHRTEGYPLMVSVGIDTRDLRSRWWAIAGPTLGALVGTIALIVGFVVLIDRRRAEQARAQQRAMVMQKLEAMGQMTASVSHDFRNLLTVMSATLRLLRRRGPDEKVFAAAEESIDRGNKLIGQLLAFARRQDLQVAPADINAYVAGLEDVLRHAAGTAVDVRLDLTPGLPLCHTDQTQFDAALMNLVTNARQAMPGAGLITIATSRAEEKAALGFVALSVSDTGSGIDEATQKRIFEPFFTTKADGGTGLGLAQVYGFLRQIGGDVRVRSTVGVGTTFTLLFPVHDDGAPADAPRP